MNVTTTDDQTVIEENTVYVLGMYDLYPNDHDIIQALKVKGIKSNLIPIILYNVKIPGYQKRQLQAKGRIWISAGLIFLCIALYLFFTNLPDSNTILTDREVAVRPLIWMIKFYREIFYFFFFILCWVFVGSIRSYKHYTRLLEQHENAVISTMV
jgi:hypothetical protein